MYVKVLKTTPVLTSSIILLVHPGWTSPKTKKQDDIKITLFLILIIQKHTKNEKIIFFLNSQF